MVFYLTVGQKWNEVLDIVAQNDPDRMSSALASPCLQLKVGMNSHRKSFYYWEAIGSMCCSLFVGR